MARGFFNRFDDVWMHEGVRTPLVDYCGALGHVSPTDLGIKAAREALRRAAIDATEIGSVIAGSMANPCSSPSCRDPGNRASPA